MSQDNDNKMSEIKNLLSGGLNQENLKAILSSTLGDSFGSSKKDSSGDSGMKFDSDTLQMFLKIKQVLDSTSNNNSPREALLKSLQPYLSDGRKDKLAECMKLLKITSMFDTIKSLEGSEKNAK